MAVTKMQLLNPTVPRYVAGVKIDFSSEGDGIHTSARYEDVVTVRVNGSFAGGIATDANKVAVEHSWDGVTWAEAGAASATGNVAASAVVVALRPFVRINITTAGAATFTGFVQLVGAGAVGAGPAS